MIRRGRMGVYRDREGNRGEVEGGKMKKGELE